MKLEEFLKKNINEAIQGAGPTSSFRSILGKGREERRTYQGDYENKVKNNLFSAVEKLQLAEIITKSELAKFKEFYSKNNMITSNVLDSLPDLYLLATAIYDPIGFEMKMKDKGYSDYAINNLKHSASAADIFYLEKDNKDFKRALEVLYHIKKAGKLFKPVGQFGSFNFHKARRSIISKFLSRAIPKKEREFTVKDMEI